MSPETGLLLLPLLVLVAGLYAGVETGVYSLNRLRLTIRREEGDPRARIIESFMTHPEALVALTLVGHNLAVNVAAALTTDFFDAVVDFPPEVLATVTLAPLMLVFAEFLPKNFFRRQADVLIYRLAAVINASYYLFWPAIVGLKGLARLWGFLLRLPPQPPAAFTRRWLARFLARGTEEGILTTYQLQLARNIMDLGGRRLAQVMIPLKRAALLPADAPAAEVERLIRAHPYSRLPVWRERPDRITGVINVHDLLLAGNGLAVDPALVHPPVELAAGLSVAEALLRLREAKYPLAVVTGEGGRAVGLATIKDLVEEITGEVAAW